MLARIAPTETERLRLASADAAVASRESVVTMGWAGRKSRTPRRTGCDVSLPEGAEGVETRD